MTRDRFDPRNNPIDRSMERDANARLRRIRSEAGGTASGTRFTPTTGTTYTDTRAPGDASRLLDLTRDALLRELQEVERRIEDAAGPDLAPNKNTVRDEVRRDLILDIIKMRGW